MKKLLFLSVVAMLFATSCTHRLTDFTVISTKNVPIGMGATDFEKGTSRVKGKDSKPIVLFIPCGTPNLKNAIDKAIESNPGCIGLVDGVVKSNSWWAILFGKQSYIVEGTPLYAKGTNYNNTYNNTQSYQQSQVQQQTYQAPVQQPQQQVSQPQQSQQPQQQVYQQQTSQQTEASGSVIFFHTVQKGETIQAIAKNYNLNVRDIISWNQLSNSTLKEGQKLKLYIQ